MEVTSSIYCSLPTEDVARYSRQLILPELGVKGQQKIRASSVLIVGAGGLGCPVAQYLAAAGVGHIGVLDYDHIEISNLHRQVLHTEEGVRVRTSKVDSVKQFIGSLNSSVRCTVHHTLLNSHNAKEIIKNYDIIVDATDNVASRYLLNDASVILSKPLVSGSALRFEGQLTVYNHHGGPCYRCLFPTPPPPHTVTNCSEGGVLGAVPGLIGTLQAMEVLKIAAGIGETYSQKLLMFDALMGSFRVIKLRPRNTDCAICGDNPSITELIDYEQFCMSSANDKDKAVSLLTSEDRVSCAEYSAMMKEQHPHVLLDVREPVEYDICHIRGSHNIPLKQLQSSQAAVEKVNALISKEEPLSLLVVCHHGNDSQLAVKLLKENLKPPEGSTNAGPEVKDIIGGLSEWANSIDPAFPKY